MAASKKDLGNTLRRRLALRHWAFQQLGVPLGGQTQPLDILRREIGGDGMRGMDGGQTRFITNLTNTLFDQRLIAKDKLFEYDAEIRKLTRDVAPTKRGEPEFEWTWYQYLCLLLTEIYLDKYFSDRQGLLDELNASLLEFNREREFPVPGYTLGDLNKLGFQLATGSGKTHLMHANISQYGRYAQRENWKEHKHVIVLTPNEGLSRQHVENFDNGFFYAELFQKGSTKLDQPVWKHGKVTVRVCSYHDFRSDGAGSSDGKTVNVKQFEGPNLLMVDEGHRGSGSGDQGKWNQLRSTLSKGGFSFEYSATFSQAIDKLPAKDQSSKDEYAKSILFDYSYGEFYKDGYGKEYRILNLEGRGADAVKLDARTKKKTSAAAERAALEFDYLVGALLAFYQQLAYFDEESAALANYSIMKPLMVMVGAKVTGTDNINAEASSDVFMVLDFLQRVLADGAAVRATIQAFLDGKVLVEGKKGDAFAGVFTWLKDSGQNAQSAYEGMKQSIFGGDGERLTVTYVSHTKELELSVASAAKAFGVINVGESGAKSLFKRCQAHLGILAKEVKTGNQAALFPMINHAMHVTMLIGSRKFTEGWDCWRVSTMGMISIGQKEGSQVIQLFGRGVRLRGARALDGDNNPKGYSLKRPTKYPGLHTPPKGVEVVQTLNVFGVKANYMSVFREALETDEAAPDKELVFTLPAVEVFKEGPLYDKLKIPVVPGGETGFRQKELVPVKESFDESIAGLSVNLNWLPRTDSAVSTGASSESADHVHEAKQVKIPDAALAFLDWGSVTRRVQRMKYDVGHNVSLEGVDLRGLFDAGRVAPWYSLYLPEGAKGFSFSRLGYWEDVVVNLAYKLMKALYDLRRSAYDAERRIYITLRQALADKGEYHGNIPQWVITLKDQAIKDLEGGGFMQKGQNPIEALEILAAELAKGNAGALAKLPKIENMREILFDGHLYRPLLAGKNGVNVVISPVALDEFGEKRLVNDLQALAKAGAYGEAEVYLLRNIDRRGIGFVEAGNKYPDFILWLVIEDVQHIVFLEPHGMGRQEIDDKLVAFHQGILKVEQALLAKSGDANVHLHWWLLSTSDGKPNEANFMKNKGDDELLGLGVVRMKSDGTEYLERVLDSVLGAAAV